MEPGQFAGLTGLRTRDPIRYMDLAARFGGIGRNTGTVGARRDRPGGASLAWNLIGPPSRLRRGRDFVG